MSGFVVCSSRKREGRKAHKKFRNDLHGGGDNMVSHFVNSP